jgi:hypothetical protein
MSRAVNLFPTYAFVPWTGTILPFLFSCNFITIVREDIFFPFLTLVWRCKKRIKNYPRL